MMGVGQWYRVLVLFDWYMKLPLMDATDLGSIS